MGNNEKSTMKMVAAYKMGVGRSDGLKPLNLSPMLRNQQICKK